MENYRFYVEIGEKIIYDGYQFEVIDFNYFDADANSKREAFNLLKDKMNAWVNNSGYSGDNFDVQCSVL